MKKLQKLIYQILTSFVSQTGTFWLLSIYKML